MNVKIHYFAWLRERVGTASEEVELPKEVKSVADLMDWLGSRGEAYSAIREHDEIIQVAVDKQHCPDRSTLIEDGCEVALFPPMTGG